MLSVPNPLISSAMARADHPVLSVGHQGLTAGQLRDAAGAKAAALVQQGVEPGDVVALVARPSLDWVSAYHAVGWVGAIVAPLPSRVPAAEVNGLVKELRPRLVLADDRWLSELRNGVGLINVDLGQPSSLSAPSERFWSLEEVRAILFTSGTTGRPRAIEITTAQLVFSAFGSAIRLGHDLHDRWLACLPLHHIGGLSILTRCAMMGTCVVIHEQFDAEQVASELDTGDVTLVSMVPTMLDRVLDARPATPFPSSLRAILVGGAPLPSRTLERCREIGAPLAVTWGMTEAASQVSTRLSGDLTADDNSGVPLPFARVESIDGRLVVRGPVIREGVTTTRDLGMVDETGRVHVHDRIDDVIISGGEKIPPSEIEQLMGKHPDVDEVAVVCRPDEQWGERPVAFLVARRGPVETAELTAWCRTRIAAFKVPDEFVWCESLPRGETGKLLRGVLRQRAARDAGHDPARINKRPGVAVEQAVLQRLAASSGAPNVQSFGAQLKDLRAWMLTDLMRVETEITRLGASDSDLAAKAAGHLLAQPGKRIRPLCVLVSARLGDRTLSDEQQQQLAELAVACELVHAATLLHDDVIDVGAERRGTATARTRFGNTASILAGDHLLVEALRKVRQCGASGLLDSLLTTISQMIDAEALQLEQQHRFDPRPELYLRIVEGKTAALFRWGMQAGVTHAGLPPDLVEQAGCFGQYLGIAFQLVDDLLDFTGDPTQVGKDKLADLREGKLTWPLLVAARRDSELAAELRRVTSTEAEALSDPQAAARLVQRVLDTGALATTRGIAAEYARKADKILELLPEGLANRALGAVVQFCISRAS